ncbi:MAG: alpha-galactosidase [Pirellula sp.]|jgi:alpha-galactosidase
MGTFQLRIVVSLAIMFFGESGFGWCFTACSETATQSQVDGPPIVTWQLDDQFQLLDRDDPPRTIVPHIGILPRHLNKYHATEWRLSLRPQTLPTPTIITDLSSADLDVVFPNSRPLNLHWSDGSHGLVSDFQPHSEVLHSGNTRTFESIGGRSSDGVMPYFQIENGDGGLIIAIGWSGDWICSLSKHPSEYQEASRLRITAGLKHKALKANNTVPLQLPSILVMSYSGDQAVGQNQFRRLMLHHFSPPNFTAKELMPIAASVHGMIGFNDTSEPNLDAILERISSLKLPIDTYWVDAGWNQAGFPGGQGNLDHDALRFPHGFTRLGEKVEQKGLRFLLWFEPERVMRGTQIERDHPSWLLKPSRTSDEFRYFENDGFFLFNLANAEARKWMLDKISRQIDDWRVQIYRQDANIAPGFFWHTDLEEADAAMLEVEYINGLYWFLDELQKRHPKLIIDGCAAGGRRLDFEMLRRSVVLWRSDSCWGVKEYPRNVQAMTMGLSRWIPLHGLGAASSSVASLRSGLGGCGSFAINYNDPGAVESLRKHLDRFLPIRHVYKGDFYPLSNWSLNPNDTIAFQFHDSDSETGIIQLFLGEAQGAAPGRLFPKGLQTDRIYDLFDWDKKFTAQATGIQLMKEGILLPEQESASAVVFEYRLADRQN